MNSNDMENQKLAELYSKAISDNVKRTFQQMRTKGELVVQVPIGYRRNSDREIILDTKKAPLVKELFRMCASGPANLVELQAFTAGLGLRGRKRKIFSRDAIKSLLSNPFYMGVVRSRKYGNYQHKYEPLIGKDLFDACQAFLQKHSHTRNRL